MPSLRHQSLPPNDYSQPRLHLKPLSTHDGSHLHHGRNYCRHRCLDVRPSRKAKPIHRRVPLHHDCWLLNVRFPLNIHSPALTLSQVHLYQQPQGRLRWCLYRGLCHLPSLPWCHHLAVQQPCRKLQAKRWYGYSNRSRKPRRRKFIHAQEDLNN